jgi:hypothetical protein
MMHLEGSKVFIGINVPSADLGAQDVSINFFLADIMRRERYGNLNSVASL